MLRAFGVVALALGLVVLGASAAQDSRERVVPPALEPFEQLIGPWRSHGFLEANKREGWDEPTTWGWRFEKGKIVGMEVTFKGGKYFSAATLEPLDLEAAAGKYRLAATTPKEKQVVYEGSLKGKNLTLVRQGDEASAPEQVTLQLLHDVRYTMVIESKKSPTVVKKIATIGATRADVRFGAAGKEEQGPKCIITGAPGTSTVEFNGRTYYVCCSGCAAEFKHDPEKWLRLAREASAKKGGGKSAGADAAPPAEKSKDGATEKSADDAKSAKPDGEKKDPKAGSRKQAPKGQEKK